MVRKDPVKMNVDKESKLAMTALGVNAPPLLHKNRV
jgi:hypothetical protein